MRKIMDPEGNVHKREPIDCRELQAQGWQLVDDSVPLQAKAPAEPPLLTIYDPEGNAHQRDSIDAKDLLQQGWTLEPRTKVGGEVTLVPSAADAKEQVSQAVAAKTARTKGAAKPKPAA